jgi:hypothetical protein
MVGARKDKRDVLPSLNKIKDPLTYAVDWASEVSFPRALIGPATLQLKYHSKKLKTKEF